MSHRIEQIVPVGEWRVLAAGIANRFVVAPDDQAHSSPFILLVEDVIEPTAEGFGLHPHRGFETVTLVLNGQERFEDHLGTSGVARAGDVQWTRAGSGILHGGGPAGSERLHSLQLWLNLPAAQKHVDPLTYHQIINQSQVIEVVGGRLLLHAGNFQGRSQPCPSLQPLALLQAQFESCGSFAYPMIPTWRALAYVVAGEAVIEGKSVQQGRVAWFRQSESVDSISVEVPKVARIVFYASPPIHEPVAMGGPFVMNTKAEIDQAFADLKGGHFLGERSVSRARAARDNLGGCYHETDVAVARDRPLIVR